ncbi:MAG: ABC transporter ATP-binding protein [Halothermotrichaceae bacterium]
MSETVLKVDKINKSFENVKAVKNVSFEVFCGEILGLLGPNGAGKTTVIRMIMGILEPDSGKISFEGKDKINKKVVGYLPEERGIYDDTRVLGTIKYFANLKGMDSEEAEKRALYWLDELDLAKNANSKIEELSKGMQQKVQFIISIIHKPKLIVLDELFSGLDPVNQDLFKKIVSCLAAEGTTVLLSSHRMNMVEELCDRIFMINKGQRVLYGELEEIKDEFGMKEVDIRTKETASESDFADIQFSDLKITDKKVTFSIDAEISPQQLLKSVSSDIAIEEMSVFKPPLHDIFVEEVKRGEY